ncbi:MAG: hypothetical protein ACMUIM_12005 [bacterium]
MRIHDSSIYALILLVTLIILCSFATEGMAQAPLFFPQYVPWGINSFMYPFAPIPPTITVPAFFPPSYPTIPYYNAPVFSPLTRVGAATIIVTNPTAGTVSVINPAVATTPAVPAATSPAPLLSLLATVYTSALYEGALSTANPLLFALLQNLFL